MIADCLSFLGGVLTVEVGGDAHLEVRDDDLAFDENYRVLKIERSELIAIREFLIRVLGR
jgi:hypothetical protein